MVARLAAFVLLLSSSSAMALDTTKLGQAGSWPRGGATACQQAAWPEEEDDSAGKVLQKSPRALEEISQGPGRKVYAEGFTRKTLRF